MATVTPIGTKKTKQWYELKAKAPEAAELWIYDVIGETFFGEGITAKELVRQIAELKVEHLDVHINSPGGSVYDGQAIYNALRRFPGTITTWIDGLAASIASVIAEAGDPVIMAPNALFMIHKPIGATLGTDDDHLKSAEMLTKAGETIAGVYQAKSGMERQATLEAMAAETWYTAQEALEAGLVDQIDEPAEMAAAHFGPGDLAALGFRHTPEQLLATARVVPAQPTDTAEDPAEESSPQTAAEAALCRETVFLPGIGYRNLAPRLEATT